MSRGEEYATSYFELLRLTVGTAALASLAHVGVIEALCEAPLSSAELAAELELDEPALVRALCVAEARGLLSCTRNRWRVAPSLLQTGQGGPLGVAQLAALLRQLPEHLRTGVTESRDRHELTARYRDLTPGLSRLFQSWAQQLAERLDRPLDSILDVGAGAGVWSLEMARRRPGCCVTGLDRGPVLARFSEAAAEYKVEHAILAGDYHCVEVGQRYDRVVLANVLHLEEPDAARSLVRRAARWLRPGGQLVVIDVMVRTEENALDVAVYELHLALRVPGGRVYSAETIEGFCVEAGLDSCAVHVLGEAVGGAALVAERPA